MKFNFKIAKASVLVLVLTIFLLISTISMAQSDLAKQYHNPLGTLKALPMQLDIDFNQGESKETAFTYSFQPIFPVNLSENWSMVSYTIIPLTSMPFGSEERYSGLGDL
jgi:hypothetical protein